LDYMHSRGVIHCDLKPGNTMLLTPFSMEDAMNGSRPHVLLVDFGLAEIFDEQVALGGPATVKGSPAYLSPEGFDGKLTQKSDTWALGVMLYEMLVGARPFRGTNNIFVLYCQVANNEPAFEKVPEVPRSLVVALMAKDPQARISARQCFDHEWLRSALSELDDHLQMPEGLGRPTSYFYRAVTFCMAAALGMKDLSRDTQLFENFDTDKSGQLDTEELKAGLARLGLRQDPSGLMAAMDLDQDGQISYTEFLAATLCLDEERGERLMRYAFGTFDLDGDGFISMPELRQLLSGEGVLVADVLPDGQTVDEVMEEVSSGEGEISFSRFRTYLTRSYRSASERPMSAGIRGLVRNRTKELDVEQDLGDPCDQEDEMEPEDASDLMNRLDEIEEHEEEDEDSLPEEGPGRGLLRGTTGQLENSSEELLGFHQWLDDLFQDQRRDARLTFLLRFRDPRVEAAYVSHYLPATLRQAQVYSLPVAAYAVWAVTTEHFDWQPSLLVWTPSVQAVNNLAWLVIFVGALLMFAAIAIWLWKRRKKGEALRARGRQLSGKADKQLVQAESEFDRQAVVAEHILCAWTVVTPWVACFFANRRRLAALWGLQALEVFTAVSNDYEVILTMLGTLMFFSMRTNLSFAHALPMSLSCILAYAISSIVLQSNIEVEQNAFQNDYSWGWTGVLLVISSAMCLSGHRNLEYQRRLSFLSLWASFAVLKDIQVDDPATFVDYMAFERRASGDAQETPANGAGPQAMRETRLARLKRGQELLRRLSSSPGMGNQAFRNALIGLLDILSSAREDLAQADRLLKPAVGEQLLKQGIDGEAQQKLLDLFDDSAPVPRLPPKVDKMLDSEGAVNGSDDKERENPTEAWGWEVLPISGPVSSARKADVPSPLAGAGESVLVPAVSEAAGGNSALGSSLVESLLEAHRTSPSGGEARAALTLRAANWLARQTGLWTYLGPWERVALLTAAAGLHCAPIGAVKAMGFKRDVFGALAGGDPLLSHVASSASTMLALSTAGLASIGTTSGRPSSRGSTADDPNSLWKLVRRLQYRARPPCALEDLKRVRMLLEADESPMPFKLEMLEGFSQEELEEALAAARERRLLLAGLVLAAADLAFLALPQKQHFAWADLARDDREVGIHAPQWLRGLAEVLAIPLYDTLHTLGELAYGASNGHLLAVPLDHLRDHARHWKKHPLLTGATRRRSLRSSRGSSGNLETKEGSTASRKSFRQDQVQLTIAAHRPSLESREDFAMLPGQVDEEQPQAGRQSPESAGLVTGQATLR